MTRDVTRAATATGMTFMQETQMVLYDVRWLILLCLVLILADLKFGIESSMAHGEVIRTSRALKKKYRASEILKRTIKNKGYRQILTPELE